MINRKIDRRALLKLAGAASAQAASGCYQPAFRGQPVQGDPPPPPKPWTAGLIAGYAARPSVLPGQELTLHVSTQAPYFKVELYRQGAALEPVDATDWLPGQFAEDKRCDEDWAWPAFELTVPPSWRPGTYVAFLVEGDDSQQEKWRPPNPHSTWGSGKVFFVVRAPSAKDGGKPAPILYKISLATYQAYNFTGGGCLYKTGKDARGRPIDIFHDGSKDSPPGPSGLCVSMLRPGQGAANVNMPHLPPDFSDPTSDRQCFEHWDAPLVRWLEENGFEVDYCLDLDLHDGSQSLAPYRLLLCCGHDEYWSEEQRAAHEQFLASGGNIAFFCGNICWWRIHYLPGNDPSGSGAFVCDKSGDPPNDQWYVTRPENSLTGTSYRYGGSWWQSQRGSYGFTAQQTDHWVYQGTGLADGDVFGDSPYPVVGYECDGCPWEPDPSGVLVPKTPELYDTPPGYLILGAGKIDHHWPNHSGQGAAMGIYTAPSGGTVFNAATVDWVKGIATDPRVERITRNVIERLSKPA